MKKTHRPNLFALNAYWFALSYMWNGLGPLILPVLVAGLVPEATKGSALGLLTAVGMAVAIVVQPVAGAISDRSASLRGRRRPFILGGTLADLVFLLGLALAPRYGLLLVAYFGLQVASNVAHGPYQGLIPDQVPPERWGRASGVKQLAEIAGIIITSQAAGLLIAKGLTTLATISIVAVLLVALAITLAGVHEERPREVRREPLWRTVAQTFGVDLRRHAGFAWLLGSRLLILVGMNLVRNYIVYYIEYVLAMTTEQAAGAAGTLLAILAGAIALIVLPAGALSDRVGRKPLVVLSGLLGGVGSLLLLLVRSYVHLLLFGAVLGISIGVFLSANWAWLIDVVPEEEAGRYLGLSNLATAGAAIPAGAGGLILDVLNAQAPGRGYVALYVLAAACYLAGTALLTKVGERRYEWRGA